MSWMSEVVRSFNISGHAGELLPSIQFSHQNNCPYSYFGKKALLLGPLRRETTILQGDMPDAFNCPNQMKSREDLTMCWWEKSLVQTMAENSAPPHVTVYTELALPAFLSLAVLQTGLPAVTPGPCIGQPSKSETWLNTHVCLSIVSQKNNKRKICPPGSKVRGLLPGPSTSAWDSSIAECSVHVSYQLS